MLLSLNLYLSSMPFYFASGKEWSEKCSYRKCYLLLRIPNTHWKNGKNNISFVFVVLDFFQFQCSTGPGVSFNILSHSRFFLTRQSIQHSKRLSFTIVSKRMRLVMLPFILIFVQNTNKELKKTLEFNLCSTLANELTNKNNGSIFFTW